MTVRRAITEVALTAIASGVLAGCGNGDVEVLSASVHDEMSSASDPDIPKAWVPQVRPGDDAESSVTAVVHRNLPPCSQFQPSVSESDDSDVTRDLDVRDFAWSLERDGGKVIARQITVYPTEELATQWMHEFPQDHLICDQIDGNQVTRSIEDSWGATAIDPIGNVTLDQSAFGAMTWRGRNAQGKPQDMGTTGAVVARRKNVIALVAVYYPDYQPKELASDSSKWVKSLSEYAAPTVETMAKMADAQ